MSSSESGTDPFEVTGSREPRSGDIFCLNELLGVLIDPDVPPVVHDATETLIAATIMSADASDEPGSAMTLKCQVIGCEAGCTLTLSTTKSYVSPTELGNGTTRSLLDCIRRYT